MESKAKYAATYVVGRPGYFICRYDESIEQWVPISSYPEFATWDEAAQEAAQYAARKGAQYVNMR